MSTKKAEKKDNLKNLQDELSGKAREVWLAGLGALSTVEEEGSKLFKSLVGKGESFEQRGKERIDELMTEVNASYKKVEKKISESFKKTEDEFEANVTKVVKGLGVPTSDEVNKLSDRVQTLTKQVEALAAKLDKDEASAKKATPAPAKK